MDTETKKGEKWEKEIEVEEQKKSRENSGMPLNLWKKRKKNNKPQQKTTYACIMITVRKYMEHGNIRCT